MDNETCVICGKKLINNKGNNPYPICEHGSCCDECNVIYVIPARLRLIYDNDNNNNN